jgi:hypothetical protein
VLIYGAGMAGLVAGNMLRRFSPVVREAQASLPDNHGALLRFRSKAVPDAVGQQFKEVMVNKAVFVDGRLTTVPDLRISNMYSDKVTNEVMGRSVMNLVPGIRYIAPDDFIATMARGCNIETNRPLTKEDLTSLEGPVLSTVPMDVMMKLVGWDEVPQFKFRSVWSARLKIFSPTTNVYQTVYVPGDDFLFYRASITGDTLILEYTCTVAPGEAEGDAKQVLEQAFGIQDVWFESCDIKHQYYGKLLPIDEAVRRSFILSLTDQYGIYSIGRFATWRQLLMDDVVKDVQIIERFIADRSAYGRRLVCSA